MVAEAWRLGNREEIKIKTKAEWNGGCQGLGKAGHGESCFNGCRVFLLQEELFWEVMAVMFAQQRECTYCHGAT